MAEIGWHELSAGEVKAALKALDSQGHSPVSGLLDVHQWFELQVDPLLCLSRPFADAQFRRAGLGISPPLALWRLDLAQVPREHRSARALRRQLEHRAAGPSQLGDLIVLQETALAACTAEFDITHAGIAAARIDCWPEFEPPLHKASVASMRLDAVVSRIFAVSRSEAHIAISHSFVFVDFQPVSKPSRVVAAGSSIVFRSKGRARLASAVVNTRSGRVNLAYELWPV